MIVDGYGSSFSMQWIVLIVLVVLVLLIMLALANDSASHVITVISR